MTACMNCGADAGTASGCPSCGAPIVAQKSGATPPPNPGAANANVPPRNPGAPAGAPLPHSEASGSVPWPGAAAPAQQGYPPQGYAPHGQPGPSGYVQPPGSIPYGNPPGPPLPTEGTAILGLVLNILIWPGLGSLVAGDKIGWAQGFTALAGLLLMLVIIGFPIFIGAWVWGIVTGVKTLQAVNASRPPAQPYAYQPPPPRG